MPSPAEQNRKFTEMERLLEVQLKVVRILKPINQGSRVTVLTAAKHLIDAESSVPGVIDAFLRGTGVTQKGEG